MRKSCDSCQYKPDFDFFSPTSYKASGVCEAFTGSFPEIIEHEDQSDDADYYYTYDGEVITDCPCWDLAEEDTSSEGFTDEGECDCPECQQQRAKMAQEATKPKNSMDCDGDCENCSEVPSLLENLLGIGTFLKGAQMRREKALSRR